MSKAKIEASVVDKALVVSFLSGREPRVWRIDMGQFLSAALEIRETQGGFSLLLKPGSGPAEEIGTFPDRKKALAAMQTVTDAFLRGSEDYTPPPSGGGFLRFLKWVFMLLLIAASAFLIWGTVMPKPAGEATGAAPAMQTSEPPVRSGVPVPADEVLGE